MRIAIFVGLCVLLAFAGEWTYRTFVRPIDPIPSEVLALVDHFDRNGVKVHAYAVRHGFRHSEVLAAAGLKIVGFPLPIGVVLCPTEQAATEQLNAAERSPNLTHPARNGRLVMNLPMWGDDASDMAAKVADIFSSFDGGAADSPSAERK
jgi:hypothetical protein